MMTENSTSECDSLKVLSDSSSCNYSMTPWDHFSEEIRFLWWGFQPLTPPSSCWTCWPVLVQFVSPETSKRVIFFNFCEKQVTRGIELEPSWDEARNGSATMTCSFVCALASEQPCPSAPLMFCPASPFVGSCRTWEGGAGGRGKSDANCRYCEGGCSVTLWKPGIVMMEWCEGDGREICQKPASFNVLLMEELIILCGMSVILTPCS